MNEADQKRLEALRVQRAAKVKALELAEGGMAFSEAKGTERLRVVTHERKDELRGEVAELDHLIAMLENADA